MTVHQWLELSFWGCIALVLYTYAGYPLTLKIIPRRRRQSPDGSALPRVRVVIAAHNEASCIDATVRNKLEQEYPRDHLSVVVVSDGSTDGTDEIVSNISDPRLRLLRQEPRGGKTLALNLAVALPGDESIVIFSDANSHYDKTTVRRLVDACRRPGVGYVSGNLIYRNPGEDLVGGGSGLYMRYENWVRTLESRIGSMVGVNGGVDAVRRELYRPMRADHLPDFILPLRVFEQGYDVVHESDANGYEVALGNQKDEFSMRVRVSLRSLHTLWEMKHLLHPRWGWFSFQLLVHKVLRYVVWVPLIAALVISAILAKQSTFFAVMLWAQVLWYSVAILCGLSRQPVGLRVVLVPYYFCLVNAAAGVAFLKFLRGQRQVLWTPRKGS